MKKSALFILMFSLLFLSACAGPNTAQNTPGIDDSVAGFWWGLWNGFTAFIGFIGSILSNNIHFYEVHNNGGWYNFGFVLGSGILIAGLNSISKSK